MKRISRWVAAFVIGLLAVVAQAQVWPTGTTRIVVPFPPGGTSDQLARLLAAELQTELRQPFIVDNRGGAGGSIAAEFVIKSAATGQTILFGTNSVLASNVSLFKKLSYDPTTDFSHIMRIGEAPLALLVRTDFPLQTLPDLIKYAKENPEKLKGGYGSSSVQAALAQLASVAGIKVISVPYKSVPLSALDIMSGVIDFAFVDLGPAMAQVKGGKLRAIAVAQGNRLPAAPDWPAIGESYPEYGSFAGWFAISAPAQTPPAVIDAIHAALKRVLDKPETQSKINALGVTSRPLGPQETRSFIVSEVDRWRKLFALAGVQPE